MGWFGFWSSSPPPAEGIAPSRSQRTRCWGARDSFFECLDRNNIIDSIKNGPAAHTKCGKQEAAFGKECAPSWVEYFKKRRVMLHNRSEMLKKLEVEGATAIPVPNPAGKAQVEP